MGGAVQRVGQVIGVDKKPSAPAPAPTATASKIESKASRYDEEQGARMRGARRRGRSLLSDMRLNSESGVETLGGGNSLGQ
jgi:hypothetical protein